MNKGEAICPKCISAGEIVVRNPPDKQYLHVECNLCKGTGYVSASLEEDYLLSLNETPDGDEYYE